MFYSQFILAKKGPLGTIWIAAHLERKLRKNQVADTDIGVSVDSILFPDVPIALRLSSHLLLGVVRIYNKKVNYLFDDCSEALLKIKQAFRSTAVDLPPEESKAPYHSITLPEKFDLDDFELPDSDIFQGNYVDHHISSREQITLQDTMEGVSYSTSKFGLDERFGDGDASGLDLDEELFLGKIGVAGHGDERMDPQASLGSTSTFKQDQHPEDRAANPEAMVDGVDEYADIMDYAQAPRTPGLVEEPNLSNVQDASACDDHLESEYRLTESTIRENANSAPYEDKQEVDWFSRDDTVSDGVPQGPPKENGYLSGGLEVKESEAHGQIESIKPASDLTDEIIKASNVPCQEDSPTEAVNKDKTYFASIDETHCNHQGTNEIGLENSAPRSSGLPSTDQQLSEDASAKDLTPSGAGVAGSVGDTSNQQKSCHAGPELATENEVRLFLENSESQGTADSSKLNLDAHDKEAASETLVLRPCHSIQEHPDVAKPGFIMSADGDVESENNALATDGREETAKLGKTCCVNGNSEEHVKENQGQEHPSGDDVQAATGEADGLVDARTELPAPEKLLSVPEGHTDLHRGMMIDSSPGDFQALDEGDAGSKTAVGRKRSFTESTLTEQSLNSVESSRQVRVKQTTGSVPNDDDLLSSILVGRRSSILKVKPTPPLTEVTSMKRTRVAPRSGAPKRKVLMDDTMVLHGDTIRQQLTNTEDIRRVRKKAPCTLPEISMIRKQHMEDEIFLQPIFTGMSVELASLHDQVYDLSRISVCQNEVNNASLEIVTEPRLPSQNDEDGVPPVTMVEPDLASHNEKSGAALDSAAELHLTSPNDRNHDMEDDKGPGKTNVTEVSGQGLNDEFLTVRDNVTAEPSVNPLLYENKPEEVDYASIANPPVIAEIEPLDSTGHATGDMDDALDGMVQTASWNESGETNANVDTDAAVVPDQKNAVPLFELDYADVDDGQAIVRNEVMKKDDNATEEVETVLGARDDILPDVTQDAAAVELVSNANHGELENHAQSENYSTTSREQQEVEFSCPGLESMLQDGSMNYCENPESYQPNLMDAETSGFDLHDRDELNYSAAGNDTEFLNVDDDELTEMADDHAPDAQEALYTENSGWSSRTRAVSKYLQATFVKEAECGRKSLSLDNLLTGKSRKEASRMFFETLVLKTRDYIHVEQRNPFDDIAIKPRTRLMKSDF